MQLPIIKYCHIIIDVILLITRKVDILMLSFEALDKRDPFKTLHFLVQLVCTFGRIG